MKKDTKIYIAGHMGLVGSAIFRRLKELGYNNLLVKKHSELDLTRQKDVEDFFDHERPQVVILAAAKVGGIGANSTYPADFIYQNLMIATNVIDASYKFKVDKLVNLGSSCIYPKLAPQPLKEEALLTGPLEPTNEAYAVAKIAAIKLCKYYNDQYGTNFISVMPTNMYGIGDTYHLFNSHVLPAMIQKFHEAKKNAKEVTLWGDGSPFREFLFSDDFADALIFLMENKNYQEIGEFINIGSGVEITIKELATTIAKVVEFSGKINWDTSKPNGTPRKLMDSNKLFSFGWKPKVSLDEGVRITYRDFLSRFN